MVDFSHRNEFGFVPLFLFFVDSDRILLPMEEIEMSYSEDELGDGDGDGEAEGPTDEEAIYSPERQVSLLCDDCKLVLECITCFTLDSHHSLVTFSSPWKLLGFLYTELVLLF